MLLLHLLISNSWKIEWSLKILIGLYRFPASTPWYDFPFRIQCGTPTSPPRSSDNRTFLPFQLNLALLFLLLHYDAILTKFPPGPPFPSNTSSSSWLQGLCTCQSFFEKLSLKCSSKWLCWPALAKDFRKTGRHKMHALHSSVLHPPSSLPPFVQIFKPKSLSLRHSLSSLWHVSPFLLLPH